LVALPGGKYSVGNFAALGGQDMTDKAENPRIRRARLSGPEAVSKDATVADIAADGSMIILAKGTNEWVCTPGDENKIGAPPMCMNPMGMQWMMDAMQGKPRRQNQYVERLIGSIRRECLDHIIVWNERSLRRTLKTYFAYYQRSRTHLALAKDAPESRVVEKPASGRIVAIPQLGGLHHRYQRHAA
jgi:hypothetical protein